MASRETYNLEFSLETGEIPQLTAEDIDMTTIRGSVKASCSVRFRRLSQMEC